MRFLLPALAFVAATSVAAQAQSADATIDHAVSAWSKVRTIRASFVQTLSNPLTGTTADSRGEFQQQRPNRLSIVFDDQDGDRIVEDGRYVWIYVPSSTPGQVIRRPATAAGSDAPLDLSAQFLSSPHARFDITQAGKSTIDGLPTTALTLVPKRSGSAPFTRAKVWVTDRDGLIRQFQIEEPSGVSRTVRLTDVTVNGPVDGSAFRFSVPSGVRIVE